MTLINNIIDVAAKEELVKLKERKTQVEAETKISKVNDNEEDDLMIEDDLYEEIIMAQEDEVIEEAISVNQEEEDDEDEIETVSSRFVESLLRHLLRGFTAKRIAVRIRCCQIVALSIGSMGEIE